MQQEEKKLSELLCLRIVWLQATYGV